MKAETEEKEMKITLIGKITDANFQQIKQALAWLHKYKLPATTAIEIMPLLETQWQHYRKLIANKHSIPISLSPLVLLNNTELLGGPKAFFMWAKEKYDYSDNKTSLAFYRRRGKKDYMNVLKNGLSGRHFCGLIVQLASDPPYKVVIELFKDITPKTAARFLQFFTGFKTSAESQAAYSYTGTLFHRVVPHSFVQGGRILEYEKLEDYQYYDFPDENYTVKHDQPGIIGMARRYGMANTNNCEFYITLAACSESFDRKYVAFGRVVEGFRVFRIIEKMETKSEKPIHECKILKSIPKIVL